MINVYRGITGPSRLLGTEQIFDGLSEDQIRGKGIRNSNSSMAQSGRFRDLQESTLRRVDGLPIYLYYGNAVNWLRRKAIRNTSKGLGVLACTQIEENLIADGTIKIIKNTLDTFGNDTDVVLSLAQLKAHEQGINPIREECYIPDFPSDPTLTTSTFLVPRAHRLDGTINFDIEQPLINLEDLQG